MRVDWRGFCRDLLSALQYACRTEEAEIGHVKLLVSTPSGHCVGNVTSLKGNVSVQNAIRGAPPRATMTFNARVALPPRELERTVRETLRAVAGRAVAWRFGRLECLAPGRPEPTYRYDDVVS
jgi:hypothetical protein